MGYKSSGNHYNYICGQINEFYSDYGPTQMEQTSLNKPCEVAPTASTPSGSASHGTLYQYSINNSTYCTTTITPMPLDDHIFAIGAVICFIGFGWIKKMVV
ncbi:hypothetical protein ACJVDH_14945 [Pedobacter sp. AW1-32]|uniref:hypothetical protein n=1 Tax=Pedobacter sp. AW1-32 TaxID=3383026 RepID=UPI003FEEDF2E